LKRVLYIRHGQSETNLRGIFAGGLDNLALTELGRDQARQAALEIKAQKIKVDKIITSPLYRTQETAKIVAGVIGFDDGKIIVDPRFKEYDIGENNIPVKGMTAAKMMSLPNREDPMLFAKRVRQGLKAITNKEGTTLILGHAGVGRMIECLRRERNPSEFYDIPGYPNGHVVELDLSWLDGSKS
jgi:probable phosphoglycerate mutase